MLGVDLNPSMCLKAQAHAAATGTTMECHEGRMEDLPVPDASVNVVISNGVINLSFQRGRVVEEMYRVLSRAAGSRHGHREREAAVPVDHQRPEALGQLNRRSSPGRRDVPIARGDELHPGSLCGGVGIPVPESFDVGRGRDVWRQGRHDGGQIGGPGSAVAPEDPE